MNDKYVQHVLGMEIVERRKAIRADWRRVWELVHSIRRTAMHPCQSVMCATTAWGQANHVICSSDVM